MLSLQLDWIPVALIVGVGATLLFALRLAAYLLEHSARRRTQALLEHFDR